MKLYQRPFCGEHNWKKPRTILRILCLVGIVAVLVFLGVANNYDVPKVYQGYAGGYQEDFSDVPLWVEAGHLGGGGWWMAFIGLAGGFFYLFLLSIDEDNRKGLNDSQFKYNSAALVYQRAIDNPDVSYPDGQGGVYDRKRLVFDAIELYREAIAHNPKFIEAYNNLGILYFCEGYIEKAKEKFREALTICPVSVAVHSNLGIAYHNQGKYDSAIMEFNSALDVNPNLVGVHSTLEEQPYHMDFIRFGMCEGKRGWAEREQRIGEWILGRIIRENRNLNYIPATIWLNISHVYEAKGDLASALEYHKRYHDVIVFDESYDEVKNWWKEKLNLPVHLGIIFFTIAVCWGILVGIVKLISMFVD